MGWNAGLGRIIGHNSIPAHDGARGRTCVLIDVTEAARRWQAQRGADPLVLVSAPGAADRFRGPAAADPSARPRLRLMAADGVVDIPCLAVGGSGSADGFRAGAVPVALTFGRVDVRAPILSARLVLTLDEQTSSAAAPVYAAEPGWPDLWNDPDVYFRTQAVGAGGRADSPTERNLRYQVTHPPQWKRATWEEEDGAAFLRIHWDPQHRSGSFKIPVFHPDSKAEGRVVAFQYDVRVGGNFSLACVEGGKFPGFCSSGARYTVRRNPWPGEPDGRRGEILAGNGGGNVHGDDGWSARGGYLPGVDLKTQRVLGYVPIHTYSYHLSRKVGDRIELWHEAYRRYELTHGLRGKGYTIKGRLGSFLQPGEYLGSGANPTGQRLRWDYSPPPAALLPGTWHRVVQVMRINDPDEHDGYLQAFLDGRQVAQLEGMRWRSTRRSLAPNSTLGIGAVWFNFYHGGLRYPRAETTLDVKRVAVKVLDWEPPAPA